MLRIVLLLLGVLLAVEVGLRLFDQDKRARATDFDGAGELTRSGLLQPSRQEELVYELKPGVRGLLGNRLVHINELGLRGRERQMKKPPNSYRIVGLGDSHMFGLGVAEGQTYLDLLERRLNATAVGERRYEAINFGTPGFNTVQEVAMFELRALRFEPDLVLVHFVTDDFRPPRYLGNPSTSEGMTSYLFDLISTRLTPADEGEPAPPLLVRSDKASKKLLGEVSDRDYMAGKEGARRSLERLVRIASEREVPVVFMMLGESGPARSVAREIAQELGLHYVNALPHFHEQMVAGELELTRDAWKSAFFLSGDQPSALAHRVYAEVLFQKLAELELAPRPVEDF